MKWSIEVMVSAKEGELITNTPGFSHLINKLCDFRSFYITLTFCTWNEIDRFELILNIKFDIFQLLFLVVVHWSE